MSWWKNQSALAVREPPRPGLSLILWINMTTQMLVSVIYLLLNDHDWYLIQFGGSSRINTSRHCRRTTVDSVVTGSWEPLCDSSATGMKQILGKLETFSNRIPKTWRIVAGNLDFWFNRMWSTMVTGAIKVHQLSSYYVLHHNKKETNKQKKHDLNDKCWWHNSECVFFIWTKKRKGINFLWLNCHNCAIGK